MPMHIFPSIDTDPGRIATMLSQMGSIPSSLSLATENDILGILQREQDHAMSLLSLSPLLSSLFISYANRVVALESTSATPSPDSEEWKSLQATIAALREENGKLVSENREMAGKLETAVASQEAFRTLVAVLKEDTEIQQDGFRMLTRQYTESNEKYSRLVAKSTAETTALQAQISDLERQREELKETVVGQQVKISKLKRQGVNCPPNLQTAATPTETGECSEREVGEQVKEGAGEKVNKVTGGRTKKTVQKAKEAREKAEREGREVNGRLGKEEKERLEREVRWTDAEQGASSTEPTPPALTPVLGFEALLGTTPELLGMPKEIKHEVPTTPKPGPAPPLSMIRQSQVPVHSPVTTRTGPEKPLSLWDRKKLKVANPPAPTSGLFGGGDDSGGSEDTGSIPSTPTPVGGRQSVLPNTARDQKRRNQRENIVAGLLGSSSTRKRNAPTSATPPSPPEWGKWKSPSLTKVADRPAVFGRSPSPGSSFGPTFSSGIKNSPFNAVTPPENSLGIAGAEIFPAGYRD